MEINHNKSTYFGDKSARACVVVVVPDVSVSKQECIFINILTQCLDALCLKGLTSVFQMGFGVANAYA